MWWVVQPLSCVFCDPMDCSMPGLHVLHHFPEFAQTHVYWVRNAIQSSHPLSSPSPSALNLSQHQGRFQWVALLIRWPKYWSRSFSISPFKEYSGLISFKIDWFYLLAVQGTPKSLLQHHSLKASILQHSAFQLDFSLWFTQPSFRMMYSAQKLNKQGHNIQPWHTPFPILNQSVVTCLVLTVASWPAYRFFRRWVIWAVCISGKSTTCWLHRLHVFSPSL